LDAATLLILVFAVSLMTLLELASMHAARVKGCQGSSQAREDAGKAARRAEGDSKGLTCI